MVVLSLDCRTAFQQQLQYVLKSILGAHNCFMEGGRAGPVSSLDISACLEQNPCRCEKVESSHCDSRWRHPMYVSLVEVYARFDHERQH